MIDEYVDVSNNFDAKKIPNGPHKCRILNVRKQEKGGLYVFSLSYDGGKEGEFATLRSYLGPLLEAMGCPKGADGKVHMTSAVLDGSEFEADFYEEADKDNPSKLYKRIRDVKGPGIPY